MSTKRRALVAALMAPFITLILVLMVSTILQDPWLAVAVLGSCSAAGAFCFGLGMLGKGGG